MRETIVVKSEQAEKLISELQSKNDTQSRRMQRYLSMPDLSRTPGSPIFELAQTIINLPSFKDLDVIEISEIVPTDTSFDLFDFPKDHPARSKSDTYYISDDQILRTHTTVMWYYYLNDPGVKKRIAENKPVGSFCYGKVYRKDEIDSRHMNVFHQMDGWYLVPKGQKIIGIEDLQNVLVEIVQGVFCKDIKHRFNKDTFPYTDPSLEMEIEVDGRWVEVLGCGVVKGSVLDKLGVDSSKYTGWAFGFGLERLAIISMALPDIRLLWSEEPRVKKQLKLGQKFQEVSKFPPITRDISFIVSKYTFSISKKFLPSKKFFELTCSILLNSDPFVSQSVDFLLCSDNIL